MDGGLAGCGQAGWWLSMQVCRHSLVWVGWCPRRVNWNHI